MSRNLNPWDVLNESGTDEAECSRKVVYQGGLESEREVNRKGWRRCCNGRVLRVRER